MRVAILGLGQIGGSVGRALVAAGDPWRVAGWTRSDDARRAAAADGIETKASIGDAYAGADLIVLAAPPLACLSLLDDLAGPLASDVGPDAVITDVASTKAAIVARARSHGLRFVGGHPMAGRELAGYAAADLDLLRGRPWVVVPAEPADPAADARVTDLAIACGARPVTLNAGAHDSAVAAISHLPLVLSAALVEAMTGLPDWSVARELAAGGWAGMTRLARGDVAMSAGILSTNSQATAERLRAFRDVVDTWLVLLDDVDPDALRSRLERARDAAIAEQPGAPWAASPDGR
jgi:prephenate dehydrogenase